MGAAIGNQNAIKHGRSSAAYREAMKIADEEEMKLHQEWLKSRPKTNYRAVCDSLKKERRRLGWREV
jgi:hypothetical protein